MLFGILLGVATAGVPPGLLGAACLACLAGLLGLVDDRVGLSVRVRLLTQLLLAALSVTIFAPNTSLGIPALAGLAFVWVAFVNAFNFMDGINGISATVTIVASLWFVYVGPNQVQVFGLLVASSAAGFLVFNSAGVVFLGDVGSYALGSLLWSMAAISVGSGVSVVHSLAPMSLYGLETAVAVLLLLSSGGNLGQPHRLHAYQKLVDLGLPHMVVSLMVPLVLVLMLLAILVMPHAVLAVTTALLIGATYIASPRVLRPLSANLRPDETGR